MQRSERARKEGRRHGAVAATSGLMEQAQLRPGSGRAGRTGGRLAASLASASTLQHASHEGGRRGQAGLVRVSLGARMR